MAGVRVRKSWGGECAVSGGAIGVEAVPALRRRVVKALPARIAIQPATAHASEGWAPAVALYGALARTTPPTVDLSLQFPSGLRVDRRQAADGYVSRWSATQFPIELVDTWKRNAAAAWNAAARREKGTSPEEQALLDSWAACAWSPDSNEQRQFFTTGLDLYFALAAESSHAADRWVRSGGRDTAAAQRALEVCRGLDAHCWDWMGYGGTMATRYLGGDGRAGTWMCRMRGDVTVPIAGWVGSLLERGLETADPDNAARISVNRCFTPDRLLDVAVASGLQVRTRLEYGPGATREALQQVLLNPELAPAEKTAAVTEAMNVIDYVTRWANDRFETDTLLHIDGQVSGNRLALRFAAGALKVLFDTLRRGPLSEAGFSAALQTMWKHGATADVTWPVVPIAAQ
ncbi:MAG: hypothetical protein HY696_01370 [Deltaproteobacteria bacterium]|nr:hypothetical protein [Deltaproteobacteria bacterium]